VTTSEKASPIYIGTTWKPLLVVQIGVQRTCIYRALSGLGLRTNKEETCQGTLKHIAESPVLRYYDVTDEVTVKADSSGTGLGAADGQPVAFASSTFATLSTTDQNYAQIEKECLAMVFA
jgi:hypothetical protein